MHSNLYNEHTLTRYTYNARMHRFAFAQAEPPVDDSQDIVRASAEHVDGITTITFNRPRNASDNLDISLNPPQCRFFLFAYSGRVNFFATPPIGIYHGFGPTRRAASAERICIPTFMECSAGKLRTVVKCCNISCAFPLPFALNRLCQT